MKTCILFLLVLGVLFVLLGLTGLLFFQHVEGIPWMSCGLIAIGGMAVWDCVRLLAQESVS